MEAEDLAGVGVAAASEGVGVAEVEEEGASGEVGEEAVLEPPPTLPKQMLPTDHPRGTQARTLTAGADLEWVSMIRLITFSCGYLCASEVSNTIG